MLARLIHGPLQMRFYLWLRGLFTGQPETFSPHGIPVWVPTRIHPGLRYGLSRNWGYEEPEVRLVRKHIPPGSNVLELGGSLGIVSASIRNRIGPTARHVIVEACQSLIPICRANASIGAAPGSVEIVEAAVAYSHSPTVQFQPGVSALQGQLSTNPQEGVATPAVTLSQLAKRMPAGTFAMVCDIEGAEKGLILNEREVFSRVEILILEVHPHLFPEGAADSSRLVEELERRGLQLHESDSNVYCFKRVGISLHTEAIGA